MTCPSVGESKAARVSKALDRMLGKSPNVEDVRARARLVADTDLTVLITGETGTGKELVARAIHELSFRCAEPFVALNCGAVPRELVESTLFGHERGSFTDAKDSTQGLLRAAGAGTMFLDEIGDMPMAAQVKLLRAVQERRVSPVGSTSDVTIQCRFVVATHQNLLEAVRDGTFRADLYYRVCVFRIALMPLRARGKDSMLIADAVARTHGKTLAPSVQLAIKQRQWLGNARELVNAVECACALEPGDVVGLDVWPTCDEVEDTQDASDLSVKAAVYSHVVRVLLMTRGRKNEACRLLNINPTTLHRMLKRSSQDSGS